MLSVHFIFLVVVLSSRIVYVFCGFAGAFAAGSHRSTSKEVIMEVSVFMRAGHKTHATLYTILRYSECTTTNPPPPPMTDRCGKIGVALADPQDRQK